MATGITVATALQLYLVLVQAVLQHTVVDGVVDHGVPSQHRHCLCDHAGSFQEQHLEEAGSAALLQGGYVSDVSDNSDREVNTD